MTTVTVDMCPYCGTKHVAVANFVQAQVPSGYSNANSKQSAGSCGKCNRYIVGFRKYLGKALDGSPRYAHFEYFPRPEEINVPDHLPENIKKPFVEAEENFKDGKWSSAAAMYRKAVDRSCTKILADSHIQFNTNDMLGRKLGLLKDSGLLPKSMTDWIELIKDDGNFALHDDDRDFETKEEVAPTRRFATVLLEYLFTLPKEVELAKGAEDE